MALRTAMAQLILRTRRMIGDPSGSVQVFSDQEIQDAMDVYQIANRYVPLQTQATIQPGGKRIWTDFYAIEGDWESDTQVLDAAYNVLTPDTSDYISGHWTFNAGIANGVVWVLGKVYDINASAADMLDEWAAKLKLRYDFEAQGMKYSRSQQVKMLTDLAASYRMKAKPQSSSMVRSDLSGVSFSSGLVNDF